MRRSPAIFSVYMPSDHATTSSNVTPGVVSLRVNAGHFSTTARRVTSPTLGPPPPRKQALKLLFHWNLHGHLCPNLFRRLIPTNERNIRPQSLGNLDSSRCVNGTPRIFLNKIWRRFRKKTICLLFSSYDVMLWAPAITWNGLSKPNPLRDEVYHDIWRWMFISNRCKVNFVVQFRYKPSGAPNRFGKLSVRKAFNPSLLIFSRELSPGTVVTWEI